MKAPLRSHGFDKPSDLDDHLAELDEEAEAVAAEARAEKPAAKRMRAAKAIDPSLRAELDELRRQVDKIRRDVKRLEAAQHSRHRLAPPHHVRDRENSRLMTVVRSVAVTTLASRIFASSPVMAALVAVVPFVLGLAVRRSEGA
ncbi:hypothetical protein [Agrobacterium sp. LMR679]|uniref:hypothetical protein n=1 Tax=Agrobacterium sp. LMR679 TaxID=3014335 RepID=UPI0022B05E5B|nr:hypothetical protein [Agrobacterium sp. LMR679]MCZ4074997.1 hypothetical protein [Agrobacterium sp. LMR679]